ncbi:hypothetical protein [Xenorhabdus sp. IM139775]|uniref:hypothetical protein n=1 Tax=Xenorhabdus sp. IM139775 TaxID=3025876 RepID=UPI0023596A57|nr:hypothetical protein [Xenorhabdus sp. IM139775]MDC9592794.1 hypothetical protein [Xenorhabdus sp. IM139775]
MLKENNNIFVVLSAFLLFNSFYILPPITSSFIVPVIGLIYSLIYRNGNLSYKIIRKKKLFKHYCFIVLLFGSNLLITILHSSYDLSYAKNYLAQFIQLTLILSFFLLFIPYKIYNINYFERIIVLTFVLQSIVQIAAFSIPSIAQIIHLTYDQDKIQRLYLNYGGIRGLALTGSPGWGLSIGYAISFLFYVKSYILTRNIKFTTIIIGLLLIVGALFSGRTAFLGLLFSVLYFFISNDTYTQKIIKPIKIFISMLTILFICMIIYPTMIQQIEQKVFPFIFEFVYKYENTGKFSSKSTDVLSNMWGVKITFNEIMFGSGIFTDQSSGNYYKNVDVGVIRNILFGGILWFVLICFYQIFILDIFNKNFRCKNEKNILILLFIMLSIMELKAMTLGFNKYMFTILTFYYFSKKISKVEEL